MLQGWKGLLLVLPLDTTHGSLSTRCAELPCNCFGLFCVNEKHIQLGLHRTASHDCVVHLLMQKKKKKNTTNCRGGVMYTLQARTHFSSLVFCQQCHMVNTVHPHIMSPFTLHIHTCTSTHGHTPLLTNDFLIPEQYPLCEPDVKADEDDSITYEIQFPCGPQR